MKKIPGISETEWQVMKLLWLESPMTANQVVEKLEGVTTWKPKTVKTLLNRLINKKVIGFTIEGRTYLYYPIVTEEECVKAENLSFLERVYGGSLNVMFANFLEDRNLTKEEIEQLKQLLEEKDD